MCVDGRLIDLQQSYQNYKNTLQTIASKIGDIEQETEEHKYVCPGIAPLLRVLPLHMFTYMPLFFLARHPAATKPTLHPHRFLSHTHILTTADSSSKPSSPSPETENVSA